MASIIKSDNGVSSGITGIVQSADSSGQLALQTTTSGGTATTAVTVDNAQNVGIGTTSPSSQIHINGNSDNLFTAGFRVNRYTTAGQYGTVNYANGTFNITAVDTALSSPAITFRRSTDGSTTTESARFDSSGNFLVGTTTSFSPLTVNGSNRFDTATFGDIGTPANSAGIYLRSTGGNGISWASGVLAFFGGGPGALERARIDSSGNLLIGYTSSNGAYKLQVNSQIFATSSTIATSDANYKENVIPLTNALDLVKGLNPVQFSWKQHPVHNFDTTTPTVGFIAQEVQATLSQMSFVDSVVKQSEVTLPDKTKEQFLGIAEGNMIAILTAALKELNAKVETQATTIATLQNKIGA
jgi:hypothetical protein